MYRVCTSWARLMLAEVAVTPQLDRLALRGSQFIATQGPERHRLQRHDREVDRALMFSGRGP